MQGIQGHKPIYETDCISSQNQQKNGNWYLLQ